MQTEEEQSGQQDSTSLLPFHRRMVQELTDADGICVMAAGLGWQRVVGVILQLQTERFKDPAQHGPVLVLGCTDWQRQVLKDELLRLQTILHRRDLEDDDTVTAELPVDVTNEMPSNLRTELYQTKACLFVTTRILVVDLLNSVVQPKQVAGLVIMNAHRVRDTSGEGFAARLFRSANQQGFIRGFTDNASAVSGGFAKPEKMMKALFVRKLFLWPRWEAHVKDVLDNQAIEVEELSLDMTPAMTDIYGCLVELLDACMKELRKSNKVDTSGMSLEQGLFKSFDDIVRRQLDAVWHTVSLKTKQLVADLRTVRALAEALLRFDSVTFLMHLEKLRATESVGALWLFHDATHTIFEQAKKRVFEIRRQADNGKASKGARKRPLGQDDPDTAKGQGESFTAVATLEEMPKWQVLMQVLQEVRETAKPAASPPDSGDTAEDGPVILIVCQEARTCRQLQSILEAQSAQPVLQQLYEAYLLQRLEGRKRTGVSRSDSTDSGPGQAGRGRLPSRGRGRGRGRKSSGSMRDRLDDLRAARLAGQPQEEAAIMSQARSLAAAQKPAPKAARGRGKKAAQQAEQAEADTPASPAADGQAAVMPAAVAATAPVANTATAAVEAGHAKRQEADGVAEASAPVSPMMRGVMFYALESQQESLVWQVQPTHVVLYDPDIAFIRQLEVYKAEHPSLALKVYCLKYEASLETDRYVAALHQEQAAFENLIAAKGHMVLPDLSSELLTLQQAPTSAPLALTHPGVEQDLLPGGSASSNALTRHGGNKAKRAVAMRKVVVDVREFMSALPATLYSQGLEVVPLTLEVGDYVLSPEICVERKSLSDLRQSFISGRLYYQASAMTRHYTTPVLLIEFQRDAAFVLHSPSDISDEIQQTSLISKLVLLTLHFPRLRLIWSRSLHATAALYHELKGNQDDPDPATAAAVGVDETTEGAAGETVVNNTAVDLLRRLPGVGEGNYRALMNAAGSLAGLAAMTKPELDTAMGSAHAAKKLHDWLHTQCPRLP